ncbi:MAG: LamG domain-containing protein [Gammaproteobacteria bacterium]|nr:LamG domain-containing protein [Gammaproteobacteria bacterium]
MTATRIGPTPVAGLTRGFPVWFFLFLAFVFWLPSSTGHAAVGHWSFDAGTGATVPDSSGAGNTGTIVGPATRTPGVSGTALEFAGDGSRVLVPDAPTLDAAGAFTVATWLRPTRSGTQYLVKKARHKDVDGYELSLSQRGKVFIRFNQPSARNRYRVDSDSSYPVDGVTWMHVAATFDGQDIRLYVNGVLEASASAPDLVIASNGLDLSIGAEDDGYRGFTGTLDEVRLYDVALTDAEVGALASVVLPTDTDGDGIPDEHDAFPNDPNEWEDTDGDGIGNNADDDDDGDGMPDQWEILNGFDPLNGSDASEDADGDGLSNLEEFQQGSDPHRPPALFDLGYWSFDVGSGADVPDESGTGNDGTLVGSAVRVPGVSGTGLELSGDGGRVLVPDNPTLDVADGFTVATWLRPTRSATQYLVKKARHNEVDGFELSLSSGGKVFVRFNQPSAGNAYRVDTVSSYPVDGVDWIHVAASFDGQEIRMYFNGVLEASSSAPDLVIAANDLALSIGAEEDGYRGFAGGLDEVRLYDVALTDTEVQILANTGTPTDTDTDGDGVPNEQDAFPNDPSEWVDTDGDGIGNNADTDDDGDGMFDQWESYFGLDPLDPADATSDGDADGVSNLGEWLAGTNPRDDLGLPALDSWNRYSIGATGSSVTTGEKAQSKLWFHQGEWWSVFSDNDATWLWRLDGDRWTRTLLLSTNPYARADYVLTAAGDLVHLLLFDANNSTLVSVEYVHGSADGYQPWSVRPQAATVPVAWAAETATLALDSSGRLWVAYDNVTQIEVRYSDAVDDYATWSAPIVVTTGLSADDIGAVVAFDGRIGVMWTDQVTQRFGFRVHLDGAPPDAWSADEVPASQSAMNVGGGMADDHLNLAVASDGTLYAAVKTEFDSAGFPKIALLVRRPSGSWDDLYEVDNFGTRPSVVLNENLGSVTVIYTDVTGGGNIVYRSSAADTIDFGPKQVLIEGSNVDNASTTKQPFTTELVVIASTSGSNLFVLGASLSPY